MSHMPRTVLFAVCVALALLLVACGPAPAQTPAPGAPGAAPPTLIVVAPPTVTPGPPAPAPTTCGGCPGQLPTLTCGACTGIIVNPDLTAVAEAAEPPPTVCTNTPAPVPSGTPAIRPVTAVPSTTSAPSAPIFTKVKVALIAPNEGKIGCGDDVVLVERQISPTQAPLTAAIRELLALRRQTYGQSGLYNALYQSNLQVQSVSIKDGVATIKLTGQLQLGGVCDDPRVEAQFQGTARQFSTVRVAEVYVNGTPLRDVLSEK